jgi:Tfp pilus assembly protein PilN
MPTDRNEFLASRLAVAAVRHSQILPLLLLLALLPGAADAQTTDGSGTEKTESTTRIQLLDGRISSASLQLYRITGLKRGEARMALT